MGEIECPSFTDMSADEFRRRMHDAGNSDDSLSEEIRTIELAIESILERLDRGV